MQAGIGREHHRGRVTLPGLLDGLPAARLFLPGSARITRVPDRSRSATCSRTAAGPATTEARRSSLVARGVSRSRAPGPAPTRASRPRGRIRATATLASRDRRSATTSSAAPARAAAPDALGLAGAATPPPQRRAALTSCSAG